MAQSARLKVSDRLPLLNYRQRPAATARLQRYRGVAGPAGKPLIRPNGAPGAERQFRKVRAQEGLVTGGFEKIARPQSVTDRLERKDLVLAVSLGVSR